MSYKEDYKIKRRMSTKRWRENNPEKVKEYSRLYEQRNSTKKYRKEYRVLSGNLNAKRFRDRNPQKTKDSYLKYQYGISLHEYNRILELQNNLCAICERNNIFKGDLCVDHDHETGKIRGLLCRSCNSGIGHLKENIVFLNGAINYLKQNQSINSNK